jgi:hypothetical protein
MTDNNKIKNKKNAATRAGNAITGLRAAFPNGADKLRVGGQVITVDGAVANLQGIVDSRAAVTKARADARATVADENAKLPPLLAFLRALEKVIRAEFGDDAKALAVFGLEPTKARVAPTAEEKAVAVVKRDATREARGTKGPKARKKVHGNVSAALVVTPAAPTEPAAPAANAPAAPAAAPVTPPKA